MKTALIIKKSLGASVLKGALGVSAVFSAVAVTSSAVLSHSPAAELNTLLSGGNSYLNELDYESAIVQYEMALEIEPRNTEAVQGLIAAACGAEDWNKAGEYLQYYWQLAAEDEEVYEEDKDILMEMTTGAESFYEGWDEYAVFLDGLWQITGDEELLDMGTEAYMSAAAEYIGKGDYEKAGEMALAGYEKTQKPEYKEILAEIYEMQGEQAWREHDYEQAIELLNKAAEYAEDDTELLDELLKVTEDYVIDCMNSQQYDKAKELIASIQKLRGDDSLESYLEEIARLQEMDDTFQNLIEQLNSAFDADDITAIETIMNSQEFEDCAGEVHRVFYSSSLQQGEQPNGHGTGVYVISGTPYVYYGDYVDGKRQGAGLWYLSSGEGHLDKYTLEWVEDMPNGAGRLDRYGTMNTHNEYGEVIATSTTKDDISFSCVNGVMNGEWTQYSDVLSEDPYSYDLSYVIVNGYCTPLEKGSYPEDIDQYNRNRPIVAFTTVERYDPWWGEYYESNVWQSYTTNPRTVDGFDSCSTVASSGTKELSLQ